MTDKGDRIKIFNLFDFPQPGRAPLTVGYHVAADGHVAQAASRDAKVMDFVFKTCARKKLPIGKFSKGGISAWSSRSVDKY